MNSPGNRLENFAVKIFRMIPDYEHCRGFSAGVFPGRDVLGNAMLACEPLLDRWLAAKIGFSETASSGKSQADFVQASWTYAQFGVNTRAAGVLRPWVESSTELLPFTYQDEQFWVLYVKSATDCLNRRQTIFNGIDESPRAILVAAFDPEKLPRHHLFRVERGNDYYVSEELKVEIEKSQLTGVRFQFMWSDDGSEPDEPEVPVPQPKRRRKRAKRRTAATQRELLLERLWHEVILPHGDIDSLERNLAMARFTAHAGGTPERYDSARTVRCLVKAGVSKAEILELLRSVAYEVVFETLVAIEEECLDKSPELESLHEDLLIAEPD
jgi:hypothetical protein